MKRNKKRVVVAVLAICALAAGGAAFTADVAGSPSTAIAGFHQTNISGAEATGVNWTLSSDGQYVTTVTMTLKTDGAHGGTAGQPLPAGTVVKAGFDQGSGVATLSDCTAPDGTITSFTCDLTNSGGNSGTPVINTPVFDVSVTDANSSYGS